MKQFVSILFVSLPLFCLCQQRSIVLADKPVPKPAGVDTAVAHWNNGQAGYSQLDGQSKDFYYWVNYSRRNPKRFWDSVVVPILGTFPTLKSTYTESLKADLYKSTNLPLLVLNQTLVNTAEGHAADIGLKKATPGHTSTDGRTFVDRVKAAGIKNCAGENVSIGDVDPIMSLVMLYIDYGVANLGHRIALLNPRYVETGIGVSPYGTDGDTIFIVQDFACEQGLGN